MSDILCLTSGINVFACMTVCILFYFKPSPSRLSGKICQFVDELLNVVEHLRMTVREAHLVVANGSDQLLLYFCKFDLFSFLFHCDVVYFDITKVVRIFVLNK